MIRLSNAVLRSTQIPVGYNGKYKNMFNLYKYLRGGMLILLYYETCNALIKAVLYWPKFVNYHTKHVS